MCEAKHLVSKDIFPKKLYYLWYYVNITTKEKFF